MTLKIIKYLNHTPCLEQNINGEKNSVIIGNSFIGSGTNLKSNVVIRGDGQKVEIGKNCILKNRSTVHVAAKIQGTQIGNNTVIGEYSVIHACKLGKNVIIQNNCVVMDGSEIGDYVIIQNNSLVPPGKKFSSYSIVAGSPAKVVKKINKQEFSNYNIKITKSNNLFNNNTLDYRSYLNKKEISSNYNIQAAKNTFIAPYAEINQNIKINENSSIWFSVNIFSSNKVGKLILGKGSNIQDNSIIDTLGKVILIEKRVTIGHNVIIKGKSHIKDDAVVGMGSVLENDCTIGNNSFIGANSFVKSGTNVPDNTIFAGNPAKFFRKVNEKEMLFFKKGQKIYETLTNDYNKLIINNFT